MALQAAGDLPQARRTGKLAIKQRDELAPGRKTANMLVGPVPGNQPVENSPGNLLQKIVENAIVMPRGVDSDFVSRRRANV